MSAVLALLHYPYWDAKPDGIWWFDGSATLGAYYPDNEALSQVGGHAMRAYHYRADEFDIPGLFARMAERRPMPDHWDWIVLSNIDAKAYLDLMRKVATRVA